jgi:hypothetical protein
MNNGTDCGCGPSSPLQPGNQIIVPPGTHIIQQPCATTSPQSASVSPSAFNSGQATNNPGGECSPFAMPTVARSFVSAGTNQTGSFFSNCAGNWGLPGMLIYFPSQGQLEILGVSQNTVTYRNRTVAPGVEILEGTRFAVGIPMAPIEVVDSGDDGGGTTVPTETIYQDATQLSNIRGVLNNTPSRIVPVKNNVIVGRGGGEAGIHWVRRQLGQMRYPVTPNQFWQVSQAAQSNNWTATLPGKPVLPDEVETFAVEILFFLSSTRSGNESTSCGVYLNANGINVAAAFSEHRLSAQASTAIINLSKDATSINFATVHSPANAGTMVARATLLAYHY